jgi:hypothetical protein
MDIILYGNDHITLMNQNDKGHMHHLLWLHAIVPMAENFNVTEMHTCDACDDVMYYG